MYKIILTLFSYILISSCSSEDNAPVTDNSFLLGSNWVSNCKTEEPITIAGITITNIIESITYNENNFIVTIQDFSDSGCAIPSGYSIQIEASYLLGNLITTSSGVTAYEVNEVFLSGVLLDGSGIVIESLVFDGSTNLDILKVDNDILYYGVDTTGDVRPNELDFNDLYSKIGT